MDKKHGLCTAPSRDAWAAVDAIYGQLQATWPQDDAIESSKDTVSVAQLQSPPRHKKSRPKVIMSSRSMAEEKEMTGRGYYF